MKFFETSGRKQTVLGCPHFSKLMFEAIQNLLNVLNSVVQKYKSSVHISTVAFDCAYTCTLACYSSILSKFSL